MIQIIGDTTDELADVQTLLTVGKLNCHKDIKVHAAFKLSSDITCTLLIAQYSHKVKRRQNNDTNNRRHS